MGNSHMAIANSEYAFRLQRKSMRKRRMSESILKPQVSTMSFNWEKQRPVRSIVALSAIGWLELAGGCEAVR